MTTAVLGLFMFGSSRLEKSNDCSREYRARIGRSILQDGDLDSSGKQVSDNLDKPWDEKQIVNQTKVNCSSSAEVFKRQLKKFLKHEDEPESWVVICEVETNQYDVSCVLAPDNWTGKLYVDSNKCRVPTYTCSGKFNNRT